MSFFVFFNARALSHRKKIVKSFEVLYTIVALRFIYVFDLIVLFSSLMGFYCSNSMIENLFFSMLSFRRKMNSFRVVFALMQC
jgi:hypothetical protein